MPFIGATSDGDHDRNAVRIATPNSIISCRLTKKMDYA